MAVLASFFAGAQRYMEIQNAIGCLGRSDLVFVNQSSQTLDIQLKVQRIVSQFDGGFGYERGGLALKVKPKTASLLTNFELQSLVEDQMKPHTVDILPQRVAGTEFAAEVASAVPCEIDFSGRPCIAIVILKKKRKERALIFLRDHPFASCEEVETLVQRDMGAVPIKSISCRNVFRINRSELMKEFDRLLKRELSGELVIQEEFIHSFTGGSPVKHALKLTKAGEPFTVFEKSEEDSLIPQKLHQIYFGCDSQALTTSRLPANFQKCVLSFQEKHRSLSSPWTHTIWTLQDFWHNRCHYDAFLKWCQKNNIAVKELSFIFRDCPDWKELKPVIDTALAIKNWGLASDIARYLIVREEGGVFFDMDVMCMRCLDHTEVMNSDFFVGFDENDKEAIWVEGAVFGAQKGSPVFVQAVDELIGLKKAKLLTRQGMGGFATLFLTGPIFLTHIVDKTLENLLFPRVYPPSFFCKKYDETVNFKSPLPQTNTIALHTSTKTWVLNAQSSRFDHEKRWRAYKKANLNI